LASNGSDINDEGFEEHCLELVIVVAFKEESRHFKIPFNYPDNDPALGSWSTVDTQDTHNIEIPRRLRAQQLKMRI